MNNTHLACRKKFLTHRFPRGTSLAVQAQLFTQTAWNFSKRKFLCKYSTNTLKNSPCKFLNLIFKKILYIFIFSGKLSPENLSKALNQTQIAAANYYSWFHKKVDVYAKIQ